MKNSIMLLFLGTYKEGENLKKGDYKYKDGISYKGIQTADAPVSCLFECAQKDGNPINKIFCIVSEDVYTKKKKVEEKTGTSYELFIKENVDVINESRKDDEKIEIIPIYYDFKPGSSEKVDDYALYIYQQISNKFAELIFNNDTKTPVYIDYTSGLRDVSFLMTSIIRYLQFIDVELKKIIYSKKNGDNGQIYDIDYIYNMYEFINGVSEFVNTGNAWQLKNLYDKINVDKEPKIHNLIDAINDFSETLSLCALANLEKTYNGLTAAIDAFEKDEKAGGLYSQMFKTMLSIIKDKMPIADYDKKQYLMYPKLIWWCAENGMLQQALTIYTEKMPIYYLNVWNDEKINDLVKLNSIELTEADSSKEVKGFYGNLYDNVYKKYDDKEVFKSELYANIASNSDKLQKSNVLDNLKMFSGECDAKYKEVVNNIIADINEYYGNNGCLREKEHPEYTKAKKLDGYLNALPGYINKVLNGVSTYEKKLKAIEIMLSDDNDILAGKKDKQKQVAYAMKYYLAVKVLRNLVNHASDKNSDKDTDIKNVMKQKYDIEIGTNVNSIRKLLYDALKQELEVKESTEK